MKQPTLKSRIKLYFFKHRNTGWIASGAIQRLVAEKTTYTPANASRILRKLAEDGELERELIEGHAHYRYPQNTPPEALQSRITHDIPLWRT